jgi:ring-1,2-phenylacetyl-CoA epoxidase subunit PaaD
VRAKLRAFGLAPPPRHHGDLEIKLVEAVECPHCGSKDTVMDNAFGPTLCQSIHYCRACRQSFQRFKPL